MNGPIDLDDTEALPHFRENSSQEFDIRDIETEIEVPRQDRLLESIDILSSEMSKKFSQEMDSLMNMMHIQVNRAINSAISNRVIPEIQKFFGNLPLGQKDTEAGTSSIVVSVTSQKGKTRT